jgi:ankyrin repeat protein
VNVRNNTGLTALRLANENGNAEIVELMKKHGAKE